MDETKNRNVNGEAATDDQAVVPGNEQQRFSQAVVAYANQATDEFFQLASKHEVGTANWLFAINGGGVAGLLAHAAARPNAASVAAAITLFFFGLVLVVAYRVRMFYWAIEKARAFEAAVQELEDGQLSPTELLKRTRGKIEVVRLAACFMWGSGFFAMSGAFAAIRALI